MGMEVTWFKMFLSFAPLINAIPSENVGEGVKAAMRYFKNGKTPDTDFPELSGVIYDTLKDSIDQAFTDCAEKSERGRRAIMARWHKEGNTAAHDPIQPYTDEYSRIQPYTEETRPEKNRREKNREEGEENTTTPTNPPSPVDDGGGGLPPEILEYARNAARGAEHPAAYERRILQRIQEAGLTTLEQVLEADRKWKEQNVPQPGPDDDKFARKNGKRIGDDFRDFFPAPV